ncbi:glycosyltransferase [Patescibacteria group bacterium]
MKSKVLKYFLLITSTVILVTFINNGNDLSIFEKLTDYQSYFIGNQMLLNSPVQEKNFRVRLDGNNHEVYFPFSKSLNISGFSVFFPGNYKDTVSYLPTDFDVYFKEAESERWILGEEVRNFNRTSYVFLMGESRNMMGFRMDIKGAFNKNIVQISDFKVLRYKSVTLHKFINNWLLGHSKTFVARILYTMLFLLTLLVPGIVLFNKITNRSKTFSDSLILILSPVISAVLLAILGIIYILTGFWVVFYIYIFIFIVSLLIFVKDKLYKLLKDNKSALAISLLSIFISILLQSYREGLFNLSYIEHVIDGFSYLPVSSYFGYHIDNTLPWAISRSFLHRVSVFSDLSNNFRLGHPVTSVLDKPPLLPIILVPILGIFGESHFIYMQFMTVTTSLFFSTFYLIFKTKFRYKVAVITSLLLLLSCPFTFKMGNFEVYNKYFAMYLILVGIFLENYKEFKGKYCLIGFLLTIGFLVHPMTLLISIAFPIIFYFKNKHKKKIILKVLLSYLFLFATGVLFLFVTSKIRQNYTNVEGTNLYVDMVFSADKKIIIKDKLLNFISVFLPDISMLRYRISVKDTSFVDLSTWYLDRFLLISFISIVTPIFFFIGLRRIFSKESIRQLPLLFYGLIPVTLLFILYPRYAPGWHMQFNIILVPVFLALVVDAVENMRPKSKVFLYISHILFSLLSLYRVSWIFNNMKYNNPSIAWLFRFILVTYFLLSFYLLNFVTNGCERKKKSVLIITPFFRPNVGGVETRFNEITKALSKKGVENHVLTFQPLITPEVRGERYEKEGNTYIYRKNWIGFNLFHKLLKYPVLEFLYLTVPVFWISFLFLLIRKNRLNIKTVHAAGLNSTLALVFLKPVFKFRLVSSTHALYDFKKDSFFSKLVSWMFSKVDAVLAVGEISKKELEGIGIDPEKISVQPTWVNQDVFKPINIKECKKALGLENKFVLGFIGRLNKNKGVKLILDLVDNFKNEKDAVFVFVGTGELDNVVKKASEEKDNIYYFGKIDNYKLGNYYNALDIYLAPSLYAEGFARAVVEALSSGVPVLASNGGHLPEIVTKDIGWTIEPTKEAFERSLKEIISSKDSLRIMRVNCARVAKERFNPDRITEIIDAYKLCAE